MPRRIGLVALAVALAGCGGEKTAAPSLRAPTVSFRLTPRLAATSYSLSWPPEAGATSYLVEIGSSVGGSDVLSREVSATSFETTLPASPAVQSYYGRVRSRGPAGESPPNAFEMRAVDLRSVIEALFFETGTLRPSFTAAEVDVILRRGGTDVAASEARALMQGWRPGSRVKVLASTNLRSVQIDAVRATVDQFNAAVSGVITVTVGTVDDPDPRPRPGTITVAAGDPKAAGCGANAVGCAISDIEDGVITQSRLVVTPGSTGCVSAHEVGHGLFGFGHIDLISIKGIEDATMNPAGCVLSRMTPAEVDAIQTTYARGMRAGATRAQLAAAGLVP